jgi:hypothetical protein
MNNQPQLIEELQTSLRNLCGFTKSIKDNLLLFNLPVKPPNVNYIQFLQFCESKISEFDSSQLMCQSYMIDKPLSEEEIQLFNDVAKKYEVYKHPQLIKERIQKTKTKKSSLYVPPFKRLITDKELYQYNELVIDDFMKDKGYDTMSQLEIFEKFKERVAGLKTCHDDNMNTTTLRKKIDTELDYYSREYIREKEILDEVEKKLLANPHLLDSKIISSDQNIIGKIADQIQWGYKGLLAFEDDVAKVDTVIKKILETIEDIKILNPDIIKKLMTFLPINLFKINPDNTFEINVEEFTKYIKLNGPLHNNFQQYRLGLYEDLFDDKSKLFYELPQLWATYSLIADIDNHCGKYVEYNIYLNLFCLYLFGTSNNKIFPISFALSSNTDYGIYDIVSESYSFRNRAPFKAKFLFGNPDLKFIGIHLIKYYKLSKPYIKNGKTVYTQARQCILPLFTFIDTKFKEKRDKPRLANNNMIDSMVSLYTGQRSERITCNIKMFAVEDGEISAVMNITHHELYNSVYYGLRAYIMDDNKKQLYFTMKSRENMDLIELIKLLNMKEVFLVRQHVDNFETKRIKIMFAEELYGKQELIDQLIGIQKLPYIASISGGSRKITYKKIKINKLKKTKKPIIK